MPNEALARKCAAMRQAFEKWFKREWPDSELHWATDNWCYCVYTLLDPQPLWECWQAAILSYAEQAEGWVSKLQDSKRVVRGRNGGNPMADGTTKAGMMTHESSLRRYAPNCRHCQTEMDFWKCFGDCYWKCPRCGAAGGEGATWMFKESNTNEKP